MSYCKHGHEMTPENTYVQATNGTRSCIACRRARDAARPRMGPEGRFWRKVEKTDGCWLWRGAIHTDGYGRVWRDHTPLLAHRYAYMLVVGPIPADHVVHHRCENKLCVNPAHLICLPWGVHTQLHHPRWAICGHGHVMTEANTYTSPQGQSRCRACGNDRAREYQRRKRAAR